MQPVPEELNRISHDIIGAAIEVHRVLGPGFLESAYEQAMEIEFKLRAMASARQSVIGVEYKGVTVGEGRMDFVVERQVVCELKAVDELLPVHEAQLLSYLRATKLRLGLLINFNVPVLKDGIRRIVL